MFCVGFDLLGGILLKHDSTTCFEGFFLFDVAWDEDEDEAFLLNGKECTSLCGRNWDLALWDNVNNNNNSESVRARVAKALYKKLFMVSNGGFWFLMLCVKCEVWSVNFEALLAASLFYYGSNFLC